MHAVCKVDGSLPQQHSHVAKGYSSVWCKNLEHNCSVIGSLALRALRTHGRKPYNFQLGYHRMSSQPGAVQHNILATSRLSLHMHSMSVPRRLLKRNSAVSMDAVWMYCAIFVVDCSRGSYFERQQRPSSHVLLSMRQYSIQPAVSGRLTHHNLL